jgi:hypothetical protein
MACYTIGPFKEETMKKLGRNDPCHCGSGKKFKKCCESIMIGGRFVATRLSPASSPQVAAAPKLTGLFQSRMSVIAQPSTVAKTFTATSPGATSITEPASEIAVEAVSVQSE